MSLPNQLLDQDRGLQDWCILHGYRGSIAHGMYEPSTEPDSIDDKDTMAVCVPNVHYYFGMSEYGSRGTKEIKYGEWDIVVYEARKVVRLLLRGNPNVLTLLWLPENLYIKREPAGQYLIDNRDVFVGRHVYKPFVGYAKDQLYKMTHQGYMGYMGEKRKQLVDKYGYDTKNAAHLIRLLRMGCEFLRDGQLQVDRGGYDAQELLAIKHGEWSMDRITSEANRLFTRAEDLYDHCTLPVKPNYGQVNEICKEVVWRTILGANHDNEDNELANPTTQTSTAPA